MQDLRRRLTKLTIPIFIEIALVMLVGAVDTFMLSSCGDGAVAAVGLDNQLVMLIFLVYQFVSVGLGIVGAQYFGAGFKTRLIQVVGISLIFNLLTGVLASAFLFVKAESILVWMDLRPDLIPEGAAYLRIAGALSFFQAISFAFSASLRSVGRVKAPMVVTTIVNLVNVVGNYALIFGHFGAPALGVAGAAWATAASRAVGCVLLAIIHTRVHIRAYPLALFRPFPWSEIKNLFKIGLPAMGEELSYCLSQVVITYFINRISTDALTTRTYAVHIIMFTYLFCISIVQGGGILVGHLVGRLQYRAAYVTGNLFLFWSLVFTLVGSGILAIFGPAIFRLLTTNEEIIRLGGWILWIDLTLELGRVRNIFACGTLRAAGDAVYPLVVGVVFQWLVAVAFAYVLAIPLGFGLLGAWIAFSLDENLRGIILMRRWHSKGWVGKALTA